jgi:ribosomal protein S18 acetylase RimI-like enzyme
MSDLIRYCINEADLEKISKHLNVCNELFTPWLDSRRDIDEYANKIFSNAKKFEAWEKEVLVGLVAVYCNSVDKKKAFITNVSVISNFKGLGIAEKLMRQCIEYVELIGFKSLCLDVSLDNSKALALYKRCGFVVELNHGHNMSMILNLDGENK